MDKQALIDLKAKVEAGDEVAKMGFWTVFQDNALYAFDAANAYLGSVDAALSLLEAVLPKYWSYTLMKEGVARIDEVGEDGWRTLGLHKSWTGECEGNLARALLIAILSALIEGT